MAPSESLRAAVWSARLKAARHQLAQVGPRLVQHAQKPSRAVVVPAVTLLVLGSLCLVELPGVLQFGAVVALAALLRSEHLRSPRGRESDRGKLPEAQPPPACSDSTEDPS